MSFASDVKAEMMQFDAPDECCLFSELHAFLKMGGVFVDNRIEYSNHSAAVVRRALFLIRRLYPNARSEVAVTRAKTTNRRKRYYIRLYVNAPDDPILQNFFDNEFPLEDCCQAAYLRGAFIAAGTITRPEKRNYHWEVSPPRSDAAMFFARFMNWLDFPARIFVRHGQDVVYIKNFESITDFLAFVGARRALERCEIARNVKGVRRLANQLVNCETYNLQKSIDAAQRQLSDIKLILEHEIELSEDLDETAQARLQHPEMSMTELAPLLYLSKSGLKHRMRKLHRLALELRK